MQIILSDLCVPAIASLQLHRAPHQKFEVEADIHSKILSKTVSLSEKSLAEDGAGQHQCSRW